MSGLLSTSSCSFRKSGDQILCKLRIVYWKHLCDVCLLFCFVVALLFIRKDRSQKVLKIRTVFYSDVRHALLTRGTCTFVNIIFSCNGIQCRARVWCIPRSQVHLRSRDAGKTKVKFSNTVQLCNSSSSYFSTCPENLLTQSIDVCHALLTRGSTFLNIIFSCHGIHRSACVLYIPRTVRPTCGHDTQVKPK